MKGIGLFSAILFLASASGLYAQPGVFAVREQDSTGTKMLTMEEAVLGYGLYPEEMETVWRPDSDVLSRFENGCLIAADPASGSEEEIISGAELERITGQENPVFVCWISRNLAAFSAGNETFITDVENGRMEGRFALPENAANLTFNPAGFHPYTIGNSLYFTDNYGNSYTIAVSQDRNIVYGQAVSRMEFGITGGIFLSGSGKKTAFYRKDESAVGTFPLLDINTRTGTGREIKYPMAGMASENVRVGIFDFSSGTTVYLDCSEFGYDQYLTGISWSPDEKHILVQVLDRSQKHLRLNIYDAVTGNFVKTVLTEDNDRFVEPQDPVFFLKGSNDEFIYRTDNRDGYKSLYLCDFSGSVKRLVNADADVSYVGNDGRRVFYTSAEVSPVENHLFSVDIRSGKVRRLTFATGWHTVSLSPGCRYFTDSYSSLCVPGVTDFCSTDGRERVNLLTAPNPVAGYRYCEISLGTVKSADGKYDNYYKMIKPLDFDPSKKYPVIVYVYGGPHSQLVRNTWLAEVWRWEMYMAQQGYIVYIQDNRGTQNRGADFEKAIYGCCGREETADQMKGIEMLCGLDYVDKDRIGLHGWSYGGFMTISLVTGYPDVFRAAVAGGPVIDWKWYEVMYGERYMGSPVTNPEGYAAASLMGKSENLKCRLLICQGGIDDTVLPEHSLSFVRECVVNHVPVDYFIYPCARHNVRGSDRIHLMDKVTRYFEDFL